MRLSFRTTRLFKLPGRLPAGEGRRGSIRVLHLVGAALALATAGCASDAPMAIDQSLPMRSAEVAAPASDPRSESLRAKARALAAGDAADVKAAPSSDSQSESLRAKARALAAGDAADAKAQALIDRAMLSQRAGSATHLVAPDTQRDEGAALISPAQRLDVPRMQMARSGPRAETQAGEAADAGTRSMAPVESQDAVLRRLRELSLQDRKARQERRAAAAKSAEAPQPAPTYGALPAAAPAPRVFTLSTSPGAGGPSQ